MSISKLLGSAAGVGGITAAAAAASARQKPVSCFIHDYEVQV